MKFSDFEACKNFVNKDKNKIIRYIEILYSKDSPLNSIQNLLERKREACKQAKLNPVDQESINIMDMKNKDVNNLVFTYLSLYQNNNLFTQLCQDQQLVWNIQQLLLSVPDISDEDKLGDIYKKRSALSDTSDGIIKRINRLYGEIYSSDEETTEMAVAHVTQMLRPEARIKNRK